MNPFTRFPLRWSLPMLLFLLTLVVNGFTMAYSLKLADTEEENKAFALVRQDMNQLQDSVGYRLRRGDREGVQSAISSRASNPDVLLGLLIDENGTILSSTALTLIGSSFRKALPEVNEAQFKEAQETLTGKVALSKDRRSLSAYYPVLLGARAGEIRPRRVGVLYLRYDLAFAKESRRHGLERQMLLLTGFYAGCFLLLGWLLHRFITERVGHLVSAAQRLASGELSARASLEGEDELAQLGRDFDRMAREISHSNQLLRHLNRELSAIRSCNQALLRAEDEQTLLDAICRIICEEAGYRASWVGFGKGENIRPMAWAGVEPRALEDPLLQQGSHLALPLQDERGAPFGVLHIYSTDPDAFTAAEVRLLEELAGDLAFGVLALRTRIERKRAEEALRKSEEMYRRIVDTASEGIWMLGSDTRTTFVNQRMAQMLGYAPEDLTGHLVTDFMLEEDAPDHWEKMENRRRGVAENYERRFLRRDGLLIWTFASATPLLDEKGRFNGSFAMFTDISKRKKAEEELKRLTETLEQKVQERTVQLEQVNASLKQADRLKDEFLSAISHELRSPLNAITGFGSILDDEVLGPLNDRQHDALAKLLVTTDRMLALVNDLLDFAKIRAGRFEIAPQETDYARLVDEALGGMEPLAHSKSIIIETSVEAPLKACVDPQRMVQVLTNLVSNSIKFTPPGGRIWIRAFAAEHKLVTEVEDTGRGIAPEDIPKLFAPFKQLEAGLAQRKGTGLGLSISKGIVEAHGGTISAESPGLEQGTTFRFTLPLG